VINDSIDNTSQIDKQENSSNKSQDKFSDHMKNTTEESKTNKTKSVSQGDVNSDEDEKEDKIMTFLSKFSKLTGGSGKT
jgi:hypothetical protein